VLGGPAYALAHLIRTLADQPGAPPLKAGELITTGTITDAWPVAPGEEWTSDYGELDVGGLTLRFT
jgi:2-oxo-3-hexenedioate decarboxylase